MENSALFLLSPGFLMKLNHKTMFTEALTCRAQHGALFRETGSALAFVGSFLGSVYWAGSFVRVVCFTLKTALEVSEVRSTGPRHT